MRLHSNAARQSLKPSLNERQAYPGSWYFTSVKTLENAKDPFLMHRVYANSIILNSEEQTVFLVTARNSHDQRFILLSKFTSGREEQSRES